MSKKNNLTCANLLNHVYTGTRNERRLCCHAFPTVATNEKLTNDEWWNSDEMMSYRKMMLDGDPIPNCKECYYKEEHGMHSLRMHVNERADVDELLKHVDSDGKMNQKPTFYEHKSVHCNLQCQTCAPVFSSTWAKLEKDMYGYEWKNNIDSDYENKLADEMIEGLLDKRITRLNWAGGEPMMMPMHWRILNKMTELLEDPEYTDYVKSIHMMYNTNMTHHMYRGKSIWETLSPFKCEIRTSMDGVGKTFEMIRDGAVWEDTWNNWKRMVEYDFEVEVNGVYTFPLLLTMEEWHQNYFEYWLSHDIRFYDHLYRSSPEHYPSVGHGMVDMCLWPNDIFDRVVTKAEESLKKFGYDGYDKGLQILQIVRAEKKNKTHIWDDPEILGKMKGMTQVRDNFQKRVKFHDWLEETDQEAYEWYQSVQELPYNAHENPLASFTPEGWS